MKGTTLLIFGESYRHRYDFLWSSIHFSQEIIKTLQTMSKKLDDDTISLSKEVILIERKQIRQSYEELKLLNKWFKASGLKQDELYYPKSLKDKLLNMSDTDLEWRMARAEQIRDWYNKG